MTGSTDIAVYNAGDKNIDRPDVTANFSTLQDTDRGAGIFAADDIQPDMTANVNAPGKTQKVTINMS